MNSAKKRTYLPVILTLVIVFLLAAVFWVKQNLYAKPFDPTVLTPAEKQILDNKLAKIKKPVQNQNGGAEKIVYTVKRLDPKPYTEADSKREITITEKELNSLITDPVLAKRVAVDLSDDLLSVNMIVPLNEEFPMLGGKRLKFSFGTTLAYRDNSLIVAMRGVSLGGVPLPAAWWGDIKNRNLVTYFDGSNGFWQKLSAGVSDIKIIESQMFIKLKE